MHTDALRERIYNAILRSGAVGLTDEEISRMCRLDGDIARPRRNELVLNKRVIYSGWRRNTARGRTAKVWLTTRVANKLRCRV